MAKQAGQAGDRRTRTVDVAAGIFLRYGFARTTMGDIAAATGLSRPALYLVFPSKEEIFTAVLARLSETTLNGYREALPRLRGLKRKLHFCCEDWGSHGYALSQAHPDAKDLFDIGFAPVRQMYVDFQEFLVSLIAEAGGGAKAEERVAELVRVMVYSMRGFEQMARDLEDLRRMINVQVDMLLARLEI